MVSEIERSSYLRVENRLPTQADDDARSEFERAARKETFRVPPDCSPTEPERYNSGFFIKQKRN